MNTKYLRVVLAVVVAVFAASAEAQQTQYDFSTAYLSGENTSRAVTAEDQDQMFLIRYIGPQESGTFEVSAAGDITLKHGALGAEVVDTSIECDAAIAATGSRNGVIDVSTAPCNTVGEVINIINGQVTATSTHNWVAVPVDSLLSDDIDCAGGGCLALQTAVSASTIDGFAALADTTETKYQTTALVPASARKMSFYVSGTRPNVVLRANAFDGFQTVLASHLATATYTGAGELNIREVKAAYGLTSSNAETVSVLYGGVAAGATGVAKQFAALSDNYRVATEPGSKMVLRLSAATTMTAVTSFSYGRMYRQIVR